MILKNEHTVEPFFVIHKEYEQKLLSRRDYIRDEVLPSLTQHDDYEDYMFMKNELDMIKTELKRLY